MTDKELIKQEIERLKNHTLNIQKSKDGLVTSTGIGRVEAFNDILKFIDSLPEESGCEVNFTTKSDDLEEEINTFFSDWLIDLDEHKDFVQIAHHFAEWQKKKDQESLLNSLQTEYEKGLFDMREEMMKDAVEGDIFREIKSPSNIEFQLRSKRFKMEGIKLGDKVKLIIIKEE